MKTKRILVSLLLVCLILVMSVTAYARYAYIANLGAGLTFSSLGRAACEGTFGLWSGDHSCWLTIDLQVNDGGWSSLKSWVIESGDFGDYVKYYYVASGHYYKVVVTADVYDAAGNFIETQSVTSSTVYY